MVQNYKFFTPLVFALRVIYFFLSDPADFIARDTMLLPAVAQASLESAGSAGNAGDEGEAHEG